MQALDSHPSRVFDETGVLYGINVQPQGKSDEIFYKPCLGMIREKVNPGLVFHQMVNRAVDYGRQCPARSSLLGKWRSVYVLVALTGGEVTKE